MPTSRPVNGLSTGVEVPGPSSMPTVCPSVDVRPLTEVDGTEHAHRRRDDHALGDEQAFAVVEQGFHSA